RRRDAPADGRAPGAGRRAHAARRRRGLRASVFRRRRCGPRRGPGHLDRAALAGPRARPRVPGRGGAPPPSPPSPPPPPPPPPPPGRAGPGGGGTRGPGLRGYRLRLPGRVPPISAGLWGGLAGGVAMAVPALLWGLFSGHGLLYPINLLAGMVLPGVGRMTVP